MKHANKLLPLGIAVVFAVTNIGCGQAFRSSSQAESAAKAAEINAQIQKAQAASLDAQRAIDEAHKAVSEIMDEKGNIRLNMFAKDTSKTQTTGLIAPLLAKLNPVFDRLFAKITAVKTQLGTARASLAAALSGLNPTDPAAIAKIEEIKAELAKIDGLEATFRQQMHQLGSRLDLAVNGLEKLIGFGTSFIPIPGVGAIAGILIDVLITSDVRDLVASVRYRLEAV